MLLSVSAFAQAIGSGNGAAQSNAKSFAKDKSPSGNSTLSVSSDRTASQNYAKDIVGTVIDKEDGSPVAGAAVTIKGDQAAWDVTDSLGRFRLKITGGTLQITCLVTKR